MDSSNYFPPLERFRKELDSKRNITLKYKKKQIVSEVEHVAKNNNIVPISLAGESDWLAFTDDSNSDVIYVHKGTLCSQYRKPFSLKCAANPSNFSQLKWLGKKYLHSIFRTILQYLNVSKKVGL